MILGGPIQIVFQKPADVKRRAVREECGRQTVFFSSLLDQRSMQVPGHHGRGRSERTAQSYRFPPEVLYFVRFARER